LKRRWHAGTDDAGNLGMCGQNYKRYLGTFLDGTALPCLVQDVSLKGSIKVCVFVFTPGEKWKTLKFEIFICHPRSYLEILNSNLDSEAPKYL